MRELIPTARISRGDGPPALLETGPAVDLENVSFRYDGQHYSVHDVLERTYTDGFIALHEGRIVAERYSGGLSPSGTHLLMSVSKSLTSSLAGVLVGRRVIELSAPVGSYVSELAETSFDGCTVQHLLDMRAGTRFSEDYDDLDSDARVYEQVAGWRPRTQEGLPASLYEYMPALPNAHDHGGRFDYRSILTDVLAWVLERASGRRFADLFSTEVWSRIGAEGDAEVTVDPEGCAVADGGICTTLRDLARFGQLHLRGGELAGERIVSEDWVRECTREDPELVEAFATADEADRRHIRMYHNKWWVLDPGGPVYAGLGINGQMLFIHEPAEVVIAKFSTWPTALHRNYGELQLEAALALAGALGG